MDNLVLVKADMAAGTGSLIQARADMVVARESLILVMEDTEEIKVLGRTKVLKRDLCLRPGLKDSLTLAMDEVGQDDFISTIMWISPIVPFYVNI